MKNTLGFRNERAGNEGARNERAGKKGAGEDEFVAMNLLR